MTQRTLVFDAALAAGVLLLGQAEAWFGLFASEPPRSRWALAAAYAACAAALLIRRRHALVTAVIVSAALTLDYVVFGSSEGLTLLLVPAVAAYSLGNGEGIRRGLIGLGALLAAGVVWDAFDPANAGRPGSHLEAVIWLSPYVIAFVFGLYWRSRRLYIEQVTHDQHERASRAVADERIRIARELHDVIGHSVSVMTVQASAVRRLLRGDQARERAALETVETTGREAMAEMRKLVRVLRSGDEAPDLAPPPSLAQLDRMAGKFRDAGLAVEVEVTGDAGLLAPGLAATAYRVVQESLTNTLKHAAARRVRVCIECCRDRVEVTVTDDGRGGTADPSKGAGLTGMKERVKVYGGTLVTGPAPGGGFLVHAVLPAAPS